MSLSEKLPPELLQGLVEKVASLGENQRYLLGITGFPASGKSTLSVDLAEAINQKMQSDLAIVVPMDGFHRLNTELKAWGLWELKGIPDSFNAEAFIELLKALREQTATAIGCPAFDRTIEEPTDNAIRVLPQHKLLIIEGNYLLLASNPWQQVKPLLDAAWYIESTLTEVKPRLLARHTKGGRTLEQAREKMNSTDLPNAKLIKTTRAMADQIVRLGRGNSH